MEPEDREIKTDLTVTIEPSLREKYIKAQATAFGVSESQIVRWAVKHWSVTNAPEERAALQDARRVLTLMLAGRTPDKEVIENALDNLNKHMA